MCNEIKLDPTLKNLTGERLLFMYAPANCYAIAVWSDEKQQYTGSNEKTLDEMQAESKLEIELHTYTYFLNQTYKTYVTQPIEITEAQYWEYLEVLPPEDWQFNGKTESFKLMEYLTLDITSIYAKDGDKYYTFNDKSSLTHAQIMEKVRNRPIN